MRWRNVGRPVKFLRRWARAANGFAARLLREAKRIRLTTSLSFHDRS
jgi:hypothetical protein